VKRARELIYTAERQASRDVGLAGLRLKPGSSQYKYGFSKTQKAHKYQPPKRLDVLQATY
jgi:hypothetical protein